jgi:hypothetical protein
MALQRQSAADDEQGSLSFIGNATVLNPVRRMDLQTNLYSPRFQADTCCGTPLLWVLNGWLLDRFQCGPETHRLVQLTFCTLIGRITIKMR